MTEQPQFTSLVGVKWSKSSLIKCLDRNYVIALNRLLNSDLPRTEMISRSKQMFEMFKSIYDPIWEYGVTTKKT